MLSWTGSLTSLAHVSQITNGVLSIFIIGLFQCFKLIMKAKNKIEHSTRYILNNVSVEDDGKDNATKDN